MAERDTTAAAEPRSPARVAVYDLRDPYAGAQASADLGAWGRQWSEIYRLDNDHVAIAFNPRKTPEAAS